MCNFGPFLLQLVKLYSYYVELSHILGIVSFNRKRGGKGKKNSKSLQNTWSTTKSHIEEKQVTCFVFKKINL